MLRMGRSPKVESNEPRPTQPQTPTQPAQTPQYAPAQPQHAQPAAHVYEPQARPATQPAVATPSAPRAVTESEALARDLREGVVSGFVGAGTSVSGDAEFKGMLRIDGRFTGRVRSEKGSLIVSAGGVVEANVEVASAKINGTVNGDITATGRVEFGRSARVRGNIQTPALVIEEGAVFEGNCRMQTQPKPEAANSLNAAANSPKVEAPRPAPAASQPKPAASQPKTDAAKPATVATQPARPQPVQPQSTQSAPADNAAARVAAAVPNAAPSSPEPAA